MSTDERLPFKLKLVTDMTSEELITFVEDRQKKRLETVIAAHTKRAADKTIRPEIISARLEKEHEKLQKALKGYETAEDKVRKALSSVVALRSQLGLEEGS